MDYFQTTSAVNAALSVTLGATEGLTHFVTGIAASYSIAPTAGRLTVIGGTTTIFDIDILLQLPAAIIFPGDKPLHANQGESLEVRLAAGGLLNVGKLNVAGFSLL